MSEPRTSSFEAYVAGGQLLRARRRHHRDMNDNATTVAPERRHALPVDVDATKSTLASTHTRLQARKSTCWACGA